MQKGWVVLLVVRRLRLRPVSVVLSGGAKRAGGHADAHTCRSRVYVCVVVL